ncbi:MAG: hypothetical protein NTZ16_02880 [Verrucomicrobia bacterium]|nr:hypothetical protein [Verrucomicrobiota bacterium]
MADKEKIKRILRANIRPGKIVTEEQLTKIAGRVLELDQLNESQLTNFSNEATGEQNAITVRAVDLSDINSELKK